MSKRTFIRMTAAIVAAAWSLGCVAPAAAEPERRNHERHDDRYYRDHDRDRWGNHVDWHRGYGPERRFYIGQRLPLEYRERIYVVEDWRVHHLRRPPLGYYWVQSGPDYLLVAVATGLVASVIIDSSW